MTHVSCRQGKSHFGQFLWPLNALVTSITCQSEIDCSDSIEALQTSGICGLASVQEDVPQRQITDSG